MKKLLNIWTLIVTAVLLMGAGTTYYSLKSTDSPIFATVKLSGLTDDYIPYHVDDATGFANGPTKTNVDSAISLKHTQGTDTALGTMTADIDMDNSYQVVNLQAPGAAGEAIRQTATITETNLTQLTDGSDTVLHDHDGITENTAARHTQNTDTGTSNNFTMTDGKYLATDQVRAIDGDGLNLYDDGGNGISIADDGNVGIGTTSPTGLLEVSYAASVGGLYTEVAYAVVNITADTTITIQVNVPSGSKLLGCQLRVNSALADGETWNAQYVTGATQTIAWTQAVAQNTKANKFFDENAATAIASDEVDITIQRSSNPGVDSFTAQGQIAAVVYYQGFTAMSDL